ncbi:hypothetical protein HWV62_32608 [Athelia sp. TMB]|nr:hypothetical protein HWV62_32608 [Athelia sp. TMB]
MIQESPFGNKGFEVGSTWQSRQALCDSGVHNNVFAGIGKTSGQLGAASVVLSNKYEDDVDEGEAVWYTGTGGRKDDDGGWGGSGSQAMDQSFDHQDNAALRKSYENRSPIRLIRAIQGSSGVYYRFDGIYDVTKADLVTGRSGYAICRFKFVR